MKTLFSILFFAIITSGIYGQGESNLIFYSKTGNPFYLIIDGLKYNDSPRTNVKIRDYRGELCNVKIIFENKQLRPLQENVMIEPYKEITYSVQLNRKKRYVIRYQSAVDYINANEQKVVYNQTYNNNNNNSEEFYYRKIKTSNSNENNNYNNGVNVNVNDRGGVRVNGNVGVGVNMGGVDVNVGVGVGNNQTQNRRTEEEVVIIKKGGNDNSYNNNYDSNHPLPNYRGRTLCDYPVDEVRFLKSMQMIKDQTFQDEKLQMINATIDNNCLLTSQIKEMMLLFTFDDDRLDIARRAYKKTYDIDNYYLLYGLFTFKDNAQSLDNYIKQISK